MYIPITFLYGSSTSHPILIFSLENILPMFCLEDCQPIFNHFTSFDYFQLEDLLLSFFIFSIDPCHSFEHILVFKSILVSISSRENILMIHRDPLVVKSHFML